MLTKTKKIPEKSKKKCFAKMKNTSGHMVQGKLQLNLKEIHAIGSEIIYATDGRRTADEFRFHELCWHSQAELKTSTLWAWARSIKELREVSKSCWEIILTMWETIHLYTKWSHIIHVSPERYIWYYPEPAQEWRLTQTNINHKKVPMGECGYVAGKFKWHPFCGYQWEWGEHWV